jgi:CMP/dCMP kinase
MPLVTITREYGSLGDEIAHAVAARLNVPLVDQDIITALAIRLSVPEKVISRLEEREGSLVTEIVRDFQGLFPLVNASVTERKEHEVDEAEYVSAVRQTIEEAARDGNGVFLGRGATFVLADRDAVVHVLITAPLALRVERVQAAATLSQQDAERRIQQVDSDRRRYLRRMFRVEWLDVQHYHLVVNTGRLTLDRATGIICAAIAT